MSFRVPQIGPEFTDVQLFSMFNIDIGEALLGGILAQGRWPSRKEWDDCLKLRGHDLWHFRASQRTSMVLDLEAMDPKELARKRRKEQAARAESMAALVTPQMAELMAAEDDETGDFDPPEGMEDGLCEMIDPPIWLEGDPEFNPALMGDLD